MRLIGVGRLVAVAYPEKRWRSGARTPAPGMHSVPRERRGAPWPSRPAREIQSGYLFPPAFCGWLVKISPCCIGRKSSTRWS
jgi:hypothetical protein